MFWKALALSGVRFTIDHKPHDCVVHRDGPIWEGEHKALVYKAQEDNLAQHKLPTELRIKLDNDINRTGKQAERYAIHLLQYEVFFFCEARFVDCSTQKQRSRIQALVTGLKEAGHAIVIEDFVSRYTGGPEGGSIDH